VLLLQPRRGADVRWVSYHFHADPELLLPDEDVMELLATLSGAATKGEEPG